MGCSHTQRVGAQAWCSGLVGCCCAQLVGKQGTGALLDVAQNDGGEQAAKGGGHGCA